MIKKDYKFLKKCFYMFVEFIFVTMLFGYGILFLIIFG